MQALKQFLIDLGADAALAAEYERDPDAVMQARGLSDEERAALRQGDIDAVRRLSGLREVHLTNSTIKSHD